MQESDRCRGKPGETHTEEIDVGRVADGFWHLVILSLGLMLGGGLIVCLALVIAIRGTKPHERPTIIKALADLFSAILKRKR